jgi:opacity protein-like surface antigen
MRTKHLRLLALSLVLISLGTFSRGQVAPAARVGGFPLAVGGGLTLWDDNWALGYHMLGVTTWVDYRPPMPSALRGLGFEAEARDVSFNKTTEPSNFRQDTIGGGPIYTLPLKPRNFRPYVKFLIDQGSWSFTLPGVKNYHHDTRMAMAPGAGAQFRMYGGLMARVDYEYQIWQPLFHPNSHPEPNGFTFGVAYDFGDTNSR